MVLSRSSCLLFGVLFATDWLVDHACLALAFRVSKQFVYFEAFKEKCLGKFLALKLSFFWEYPLKIFLYESTAVPLLCQLGLTAKFVKLHVCFVFGLDYNIETKFLRALRTTACFTLYHK